MSNYSGSNDTKKYKNKGIGFVKNKNILNNKYLTHDELEEFDFDNIDNASQTIKPLECHSHHPLIAAIDIGTNSCRLLIAKLNVAGIRGNFFKSKPKPLCWHIVDSYAKVVRLGEGLFTTNMLLEDAIDRTMEALRECKDRLDKLPKYYLKVVATEACRRAKNKDILIQRAKNELNFNVKIISAKEEANLALKGCSIIFDQNIPYSVVFDIGGGSTEVILVRIDKDRTRIPGYPVFFKIIDYISIPYGVVTTSESMANQEQKSKVYNDLNDSIKDNLNDFVKKNNIMDMIEKNQLQVTGSSGTITTLASFHLNLDKYNRKIIDGLIISQEEIKKSIEKIFQMDINSELRYSNIGFGRSDYIVTGSVILKALCESIPVSHLRVADRGVREGILTDIMTDIIKI